jgi:hypothetical protein
MMGYKKIKMDNLHFSIQLIPQELVEEVIEIPKNLQLQL